ncbi:MAG: hypothetical protein WA726_06580 [Acidimicrobiia bacterium]
MFRKIFAVLTALIAALLLVGTAWALGDQPGATSTTTTVEEQSTLSEASSSTTVDDSTFTDVTTAEMEANEPTTTTLDDDDHVEDGSGQGDAGIDDDDQQGVVDDHTTTTMDDDQVSLDLTIPSTTYQVDDAGVVQLEVTAGVLSVVGITAADGWTYEVKVDNDDELKVKFSDGSSEVEFEAEIEHSQIVVDIGSETDD